MEVKIQIDILFYMNALQTLNIFSKCIHFDLFKDIQSARFQIIPISLRWRHVKVSTFFLLFFRLIMYFRIIIIIIGKGLKI